MTASASVASGAQRRDPGPRRHDLADVPLVKLHRAGHDALLHVPAARPLPRSP